MEKSETISITLSTKIIKRIEAIAQIRELNNTSALGESVNVYLFLLKKMAKGKRVIFESENGKMEKLILPSYDK